MSSDITLGETIYRLFTTRAFATGIPGTLGGTPVVSAYENDSVTQITAGITLGVDHDSVTGLNLLTLVMTSGNGYESGKDYSFVITTGTVDSVSVVGEVVIEVTISRSAAAVDLANGTDGLGALLADILDKVGAVSEAAAAGDPSATESVMQYVKQIVNVLVGTTGVTTFPAAAAPGNNVSLAEIIRSIYDDTNETQGDDVPGLIAALNDISTANVNTEMVDVMKTDILTATPQAAPPTTPTFQEAVMLVYDAIVHKLDVTATLKEFHNNAGTVIWKKTLSDDGTIYSEAESVSGP